MADKDPLAPGLTAFDPLLEPPALEPPAIAPGAWALFLDLDGTLTPIRPRPDDVGFEPALNTLLAETEQALEGRLAIVSGRSLSDLDRILGAVPRHAAALHGLERRSPGAVWRKAPHPGLDAARQTLTDLARADRGLILEDKGLSLALHYRLRPGAADGVMEAAQRLADATGLKLQLGDRVAELLTPGCDKGDSVRAFMAAAPFQGARPVFVGDDLTDEDGFTAAAALGGFGVLVGPARPSAARYVLAGPDAVRAWIGRAAADKAHRR